ncbi:MAG: BamA/TamA family outer membrane protein [Chloroherpetonaceae bacterium]|nr:BamA/TamA family outer membrane protein [Chloroherpetonaceae bacterium]
MAGKQRGLSVAWLGAIWCWATHALAQSPSLIRDVEFVGNRAVSEQKLLSLFALPQPYDSARFAERFARLSRLYQRLGYYDFRIDSVVVQPPKLVAYLSEGEAYLVSKIAFSGNHLLSSEELETLCDTKVGEPLDQETLENDIDEILRRYETLGRPFSKVLLSEPRFVWEEIDGKRKPRIELEMEIQEGKFVRLVGTRIVGNSSTKPEVIEREIRFREGEAFQEEKFNLIQTRLERANFFERVFPPELLIVKNDDADTLDAIVKIELVEGNPNTFDGVVGYQPPQNPNNPNDAGFFTGLINISLQNMFGTGRRLDVKWLKPNQFTQEARLRYQEPYFVGLPLNLIFDFAQLKQDTTFAQLQLGLSASYRLADNFFLTSSFSREEVNPIFEGAAIAQVVFPTTIALTGVGAIYDSRDYPPNPQSGFYLRNDYRIGRKIISASDSLLALYSVKTRLLQQRVLLEAEFYQRVFKRQVLAARFRGEAILADEIQFSDLMRFGGAQSLRGYREQQFLASQLMWLNLEHRFLLSRKTFIFGFCDIGYFFKPRNPLNALDGSLRGWRRGVGVGARVDTPLGILAISYALGEGDTFATGKVHFGVVSAF